MLFHVAGALVLILFGTWLSGSPWPIAAVFVVVGGLQLALDSEDPSDEDADDLDTTDGA